MAAIQKKNKFGKLHLCPWSFAQGQKENQKVNKKMEEKMEKEKKEKKKRRRRRRRRRRGEEEGKEPEKWKGSWSQREVTTIDEFEMVPDSEDDCQMFCWGQKKTKKVQEKTPAAKVKDEKDKELERLQAPLKFRPCTELFLGFGLPERVSQNEIHFSKKLNRILIDRERGRERLHRDKMAKAEWPELSQRRIEFNDWQKHISEDPDICRNSDFESGLN